MSRQLERALAHHQAGRFDEAKRCYDELLRAQPKNADALHYRGLLAHQCGEHGKAIDLMEQARALAPKIAHFRANLGAAYAAAGRYRQAIAEDRAALAIDPRDAGAENNLADALLATGAVDEALAHYREALRLGPSPRIHSNLLYAMCFAPDGEGYLAGCRDWDARWGMSGAAAATAKDPQKRLRIGYVSPDFRWHSVAHFFLPLIAAHDRASVEVFCYAELARTDKITDRIGALADGWSFTYGRSDDEVAAEIRHDCVDVLVDLAGHTSDNRLGVFARRPAPVQLSWLGYPEVTGLSAIDYRLGDAVADPPLPGPPARSGGGRTEEIVYLGRPFLCYRPLEEAPAVGPLPAREAGYVTFASFNNFAKVNPRVIERWARILVAVPGARLRLKSAALGDAAIAGDVADRFASFGVARERLVLAGRTPRAGDHLAQYREVDIALDPFPYGGTTTSCESLWMGVPVVSERGARHAGRVGAALLEGIGLGELVADGADDYVAKAAALAGDLERLALLRAELRARMERSPLCDAAGFARALERTYRELFTRWCAG